MSPNLIVLLLAAALIIAVAGIVVFASGSADQSSIVRSESVGVRTGLRDRVVHRADRVFRRTALGSRLAKGLTEANLRAIYPIEFALITLSLLVLTFMVTNQQVTWFYALLLTVGVGWGAFKVLQILRERQYRLFLRQLPELARVLANSTSAGLSIRTALQVAASELNDPARRELEILNHELNIGTPIDIALERMETRIPGRDLTVLIGTLVISQRSGGSLITALRGMAEALEDRKETAREVRTTITQSKYTGYMVVAFGVFMVLMFNAMSPGLLYDLTSSLLGQVAIGIAALAYTGGLLMISRLTKVQI